jgi:low temperature requirement protein LtrA
MARFQRKGGAGEAQRTTALELFYDLVFVFAVTQVSHLLLARLTWEGAGQAAIILLAVWWSWNYTTWVTNELDPDSSVVRVVLIGLLLASLLMAIAIPGAFGGRGALFACSYVAIQVGRHVFLTFGAEGRHTPQREAAGRILTWFCAAGILWIAGGFADGKARTILWLCALAVDYGAPLVLYWVPGRARLAGDRWQVETTHFAERFGLFVIIALGESIVVTGATTADLELTTVRLLALAIAFLGSAAMWWLYFTSVAARAEHALADADDRTTLARDAYTYGHVLIVAGIILAAVGDELVIAHPTRELSSAELIAVIGGPALYLVAHVVLRLRLTGAISRRRSTGAAACVVAGAIGSALPAIAVAGLLLAVLTGVVVADQIVAAQRAAGLR